MLNEYTPGCIYQRILNAFSQLDFGEKAIIEKSKDLFIDLLLPAGSPVTFTRALERRKEIEKIYEEIKDADLIIITLGYIECWYDSESGLFLNRMPEPSEIKKFPKRYIFKRLTCSESIELLQKAIQILSNRKILLTVSPVPIQTTFIPNTDAVLSNSYSKSVLRVVVEHLYRKFPNVDYFPSYEIILSLGTKAFMEDNVHVKDEVVRKVSYFIENYVENI
ncbi:GSCFA domain-containing protein [Thermodesulfovibrio aggregans]|uniref:GSCFA domain-containing protein n=1 Tax=Thermodesulfovibrio aggregans TaxID=86166 RepID=UPI0009E7C8F1